MHDIAIKVILPYIYRTTLSWLLLIIYKEVLLYDPTMNKQTKEKTIKYANVNFWREIAGKNNRSYNYHHRKLYRMMEGNTFAIQAQVEDLMLETLDGLV